ncbi:MAG: radical SAM protein [Planctomycetes bacterium]|nr:radical SAM protein [Planctomycetota bacterium]
MNALSKAGGYLAKFVFTRYFTPGKFLNLVRIFIEYKTRKEVLRAYPYCLVVDPCNSCMLACPLCPTGQGTKGRTKAMMSFDDYKRILDELKNHLYEIYLFNWGESLLNKDIFRMVDYAHGSGIRTRLSSNLNYFEDGFAEKLVASGLDHLIVSLDGTNQHSYKKYRRKGSFEKVIDAVNQIVAEKKRRKSKTPILTWQFLVMKHNEKEVPAVHHMARELEFDIVRITPIRTDTAQEIFQTDEEKMENSKQWLPEDEKLSRFDYGKKKKVITNANCKYLWSMPSINPDGSLSPCCGVYPEKYDFGNVLESGFAAIWNNKKYVAARRVVSGKKPDMATVCVNCVKNGFI